MHGLQFRLEVRGLGFQRFKILLRFGLRCLRSVV